MQYMIITDKVSLDPFGFTLHHGTQLQLTELGPDGRVLIARGKWIHEDL